MTTIGRAFDGEVCRVIDEGAKLECISVKNGAEIYLVERDKSINEGIPLFEVLPDLTKPFTEFMLNDLIDHRINDIREMYERIDRNLEEKEIIEVRNQLIRLLGVYINK